MPVWERSAQDTAEAEHPPPKEPQDEPKFRSAWGPALIVIAFGAGLIAAMIAFGWSFGVGF